MLYIHWLVLLIYGLLTLGAMMAVLLDRKEPAKTMAWLLVLLFLPIVGIVLFFFFGQNTRRKRMIGRKTLGQIRKRSMTDYLSQVNSAFPLDQKELIQLFVNQNYAFPFKDNDVDIFVTGKDLFDDMIASIRAAKSHIHLETYIFEDDELGNRIADALMEKSRQGIEVRLLYDDVGCWNVSDSFFERMKMDGVDVRSFLPVRFPLFTSKMNYRNHRKICVIDGTIGYIGGMNIADRYVNGTPKQSWRDTHLKITGKAVYGLQSTFLADWFFMDRTLITDRKYYPAIAPSVVNDCYVQIVTSSSADKWCNIMQGYVKILNDAKHYVYMESPYFLPTQSVLFAMQTAALSGVDVQILLPERGDSRIVDVAGRSFFSEVIKAGVKVNLYTAGFNHTKLLVCDDCISSVGSTNIDSRSFENNMEVNAFIYDSDVAIRLRNVFENDMQYAKPVESVQTQPLLQRLWQSIVRILTPLL